jgi:hypothetical protein
MRARDSLILAALLVMAGLSAAQAGKAVPGRERDRERLVGAWHLVRIESAGANANAQQPRGMLIYTRDGHVAVQLMYPKAEHVLSNEYVKDGYEASFGRYEVDESRHTVTHHVAGSNTGDLLVGKDLARVYQLSEDGRRLVIRPVNAEEHWSVTWEHY